MQFAANMHSLHQKRILPHLGPEDVGYRKLDWHHSGSQRRRSLIETHAKCVEGPPVKVSCRPVKKWVWKDGPDDWRLQLTVGDVELWSWCLTCNITAQLSCNLSATHTHLPVAKLKAHSGSVWHRHSVIFVLIYCLVLVFQLFFSFSLVLVLIIFLVLVLAFVNEFVIFPFFSIFVFVFVNENHTAPAKHMSARTALNSITQPADTCK